MQATRKRAYSLSAVRRFKTPGFTSQLLTATSKMPSPSFGLPAGKACPNAHGEICGHCYAKKGLYKFTGPREAMNARFAWTRECMRTESGRREWVAVMVRAISATKCEFFRIHDSGDFFSVEYVRCWIEVCKALPMVRFWAPTREYQSKCAPKVSPFAIVGQVENPRLPLLRELASLPNVTVRPSALTIGVDAPVVDGLQAGSGVDIAGAVWTCDARERDGQCGECRVCWMSDGVAVSYPLH